MDPYNHSTPISTKLLILDTRKFEQWKFRIQQYLQYEQYALWEVIEFGDSYKAPLEETAKDKGPASEVSSLTKKKGRTVAITAEDMQKRKNDVKTRTTLFLALPDEHQLRFSKYDFAKELWEAILKTFGRNKATKKTKKNQLKQQYGNFKAEGSETLEQTFNRLHAIDPKVEEPAPKVMIAIDGIGVIWLRKMKLQRIMLLWSMKKPRPTFRESKLDKDMKGVGFKEYCAVPPPPAQFYSPSKKDMSWIGLPDFDHLEFNCNHDTWVDKGKTWTRVNHDQDNMKNTSTPKSMTPRAVLLKSGTKPINRPFFTARPTLKSAQPKTSFVKTDIPRDNIDDKGYWDSGCSRHMTGNISYLSEYEPFNEGYVSFGHGRGKITSKGLIKTDKLEFENVYFVEELKYNLFSVSKIYDNKNSILFTDTECLVLGKDFKFVNDKHVLLRTPRQQNMYTLKLKNVVPHKNLTCLIAKASIDESMLWHR
nr:ribonuclease H-like domain-containing protein [Tanacetum cinerariifolium]